MNVFVLSTALIVYQYLSKKSISKKILFFGGKKSSFSYKVDGESVERPEVKSIATFKSGKQTLKEDKIELKKLVNSGK
jgi:hypothetical protein